MNHKHVSRILASLVIFVLVAASFSSSALAVRDSTFTVNSTNDVVDSLPGDGVCETHPGNGVCTLRAAIMESNALPGADRIILPAGDYHLTIPGSGEDESATGDLDINDSLSLIGNQSTDTIIDALNLQDRAVHIPSAAADVSMSNVAIRNATSNEDGAGIASYASLNLDNVLFYSNFSYGSGGAIFSAAPLSIYYTVFGQCRANLDGGTIYSTSYISIDRSPFVQKGSNSSGGALYLDGEVTARISNTYIGFVYAVNLGGAIYNNGGNISISNSTIAYSSGELAGGIYNTSSGSIDLRQVDFVHNIGGSFSGGIYNLQGTIHGQDLYFDSNQALQGGALANFDEMYISHSVFVNNTADFGGAIGNYRYANFNLTDSSILSNTVAESGGGIFNTATFNVSNTTLNANQATLGGGINNSGILGVTNSTVSGNIASSNGGGIYNSGTTLISSSTIAGNQAATPGVFGRGGGIYNAASSPLIFRNTILYNNHHVGNPNPEDDDCFGTLTTQHYNLVGSLNNCTLENSQGLDLIGVNPLLGSLADNGGPTQTHALGEDSPAIDAGNPTVCYDHLGTILYHDQRGYLRYWDGDGDGIARCDIGSFEYGSVGQSFLPIALK